MSIRAYLQEDIALYQRNIDHFTQVLLHNQNKLQEAQEALAEFEKSEKNLAFYKEHERLRLRNCLRSPSAVKGYKNKQFTLVPGTYSQVISAKDFNLPEQQDDPSTCQCERPRPHFEGNGVFTCQICGLITD